MDIIDDFFGFLFNIAYDICGNYILVIFIASCLIALIRSIKNIFQLWNQKNNALLYPSIQKIKRNKVLTDTEKADQINLLTSKSGKNMIINIVLNVILYFITISIFAVSLNPQEYVSDIDVQTKVGFLFFDDLFAKKFNIVIPLVCAMLTIIGNNFMIPRKYITKEKIKKTIINFIVETGITTLISIVSSQMYLLMYLTTSILTFIVSIIITPYKIKVGQICENARRLNDEEIEREKLAEESQNDIIN